MLPSWTITTTHSLDQLWMISHLSFLMVVVLTFSAQKKSMACCLPLTPLGQRSWKCISQNAQGDCIEYHSSCDWPVQHFYQTWVNYQMNGRSRESHLFLNQESYRISLLSIWNIQIRYFEEHHPISSQQWRFTHGMSTTGALMDATDHCFRELEQGHDICTVFFDYSKAFDSVPHRLLLQKLKNHGVHQQILRWLAHYLSSHTQYVFVWTDLTQTFYLYHLVYHKVKCFDPCCSLSTSMTSQMFTYLMVAWQSMLMT